MKSLYEIARERSGGGRRRRSESGRRTTPEPAAPAPEVTDVDDAALHRLIVSGWVVALSYFPSGMLHAVGGNLVYLRDLALGMHLLVSVIWIIKIHHVNWVARSGWVVLITPLLLVPAIMNREYTMEALRTCKWSLCWLDWVILGHFVRLYRRWTDELKLLAWVTAATMCAEVTAGLYEWVSGKYLFPTVWGERTAFGVSAGWDQSVGGQMRIRGLQRDVFSFSNIMAMNAVAAMAWLTITRKAAQQFAAVAWFCVFAGMMVVSGGRSALFGALAAAVYTAGLFTIPRFTVRNERRYVLLWVAIAIAMSFIGVGKFTDFVGSTIFGGSYIGDSESAFMRDGYWVKMLGDFWHHPAILLVGGPLVSLVDSQVDPMFHWADNQMLWNAYHLGLAGAVAVVFLFYRVLEPDARDDRQRKVRQALILFLLFVVGEGIARESLTFIGCLPLFVLCGYESATEMLARQNAPSPSPLRRVSSRRRSSGGTG